MKNHKTTGHPRKRSTKGLWLSLLMAPFVVVGWAVYAGHVASNGIPGGEHGGWSSEVLSGIHEVIVTSSPVAVANACGLGASSCFKCHNGKRAAAPGAVNWHTEHEKVNHSCAGCHKGNERLMIEKMAHRDLIADPRTKPEETCAKCHMDGNTVALIDKYKSTN